MSEWAKKDQKPDAPEDPGADSPVKVKASKGVKEKITSNEKILADTGDQWSELSLTTGTSLATTATFATQQSSKSRLRDRIKLGVAKKQETKVDLEKPSLPELPKFLAEDDDSREESIGASDSSSQLNRSEHAQSMLNDAIMIDRTLDELENNVRKRPKSLLLGKCNIITLFLLKKHSKMNNLKLLFRYPFSELRGNSFPTINGN